MSINLITNLSGYPNGTATAKRIKLIGKAIQASGTVFRVLTNSVYYNELNVESEGMHQNISFQYLHKQIITKSISKYRKVLYFALGCFNLLAMFFKFDRRTDQVYSYNHGELFNVYIILLCRLFRIKLIQEINEWSHNDTNKRFEKYVIEGLLIKYSNAAVVISNEIENKVLKINPEINLLKVPILEEFSTIPNHPEKYNSDDKYCFWMGDVDGYINDVLFAIKACAILYSSGLPVKFYVSGPFSKETELRIEEVALQNSYPLEFIKLLGFLSETDLERYSKRAYLYIVPLWNNERSKSRFPTKIGAFMQAGNPVISCKIGEVGNMLTDSVNVLFYKEDNLEDLAGKIRQLFVDNDLYSVISQNSYNFALNNFNYANYSNQFKSFFEKL